MICTAAHWDMLIKKYNNKVPTIEQILDEYKYGCPKDQLVFNYFWNNYINIAKIIPIDENILEWTDLKTVDEFVKILDDNEINYKTYNYQEYINFLNNNPNINLLRPEKTEYNKIFRFIKINDFQDCIVLFTGDFAKKIWKYKLIYAQVFKQREEMVNFYNETYIKNI
jgi:hypothetical protein